MGVTAAAQSSLLQSLGDAAAALPACAVTSSWWAVIASKMNCICLYSEDLQAYVYMIICMNTSSVAAWWL